MSWNHARLRQAPRSSVPRGPQSLSFFLSRLPLPRLLRLSTRFLPGGRQSACRTNLVHPQPVPLCACVCAWSITGTISLSLSICLVEPPSIPCLLTDRMQRQANKHVDLDQKLIFQQCPTWDIRLIEARLSVSRPLRLLMTPEITYSFTSIPWRLAFATACKHRLNKKLSTPHRSII